MTNLLYKEFKLAVHPTCYIFLLFAVMLLIPNYPYHVAFFYQTLAIFFIFLTGNATNDVFFTTLLPIRKRDAVKARFVTVIFFQLAQILVSIPFAILRARLNLPPNAAGMEANIALFGLALAMFGVFNVIFLPGFYRTAYQTGKPFMLACAAMLVFIILAELAIQLNPIWRAALDTTAPAYLPQQLVVLALGAGVYALLTWAGNALSARAFERLDL